MFLHMEFFSLLSSVAAGSRGHLCEWGAPLSCLHSLLGEEGSKTGPRSVCPDFLIFNRQSTQFAWCTDPFAHGLLNSLSHGLFPPVLDWSALEAASPPCLCPSGSSKTNSLLFFSSAHLQSAFKKKTSLCSFCLLNWEKGQCPKPKALTFTGSMALIQASTNPVTTLPCDLGISLQ